MTPAELAGRVLDANAAAGRSAVHQVDRSMALTALALICLEDVAGDASTMWSALSQATGLSGFELGLALDKLARLSIVVPTS